MPASELWQQWQRSKRTTHTTGVRAADRGRPMLTRVKGHQYRPESVRILRRAIGTGVGLRWSVKGERIAARWSSDHWLPLGRLAGEVSRGQLMGQSHCRSDDPAALFWRDKLSLSPSLSYCLCPEPPYINVGKSIGSLLLIYAATALPRQPFWPAHMTEFNAAGLMPLSDFTVVKYHFPSSTFTPILIIQL